MTRQQVLMSLQFRLILKLGFHGNSAIKCNMLPVDYHLLLWQAALKLLNVYVYDG